MVHGLDPEEVPYLNVELTEEQLNGRKQKFNKVLSIVQHFMKKLIKYMEGTPTLIVTTDSDGYVLDIYGDPTIKDMVDSLGITVGVKFEEKKIGTNSVFLALKHKIPIALIGDDHFQQCLSGVACYSAPFCYSTDDRLMGTVSIMTMLNYASHFHLGLLSSAVDTIEREIQLQAQNHELHLLNNVLMDSTPLGIVLTDQNNNILEYNSSAEEILNIKKETVMEHGITEISFLESYIQHVLLTGEQLENVEVKISLQESNAGKTILLDVLPLYDGPSQLIGIFAQFRDITTYQDLQKKVIESEKLSAIGKLGAGLAHEIRNPLTSIIGLTQLLNESNQNNKYLEIITDELERMKNLINQFVSLGKPTIVNPQHCNLNKIIQNTVDLMNSNAYLHNVNIKFDCTEPNIMVNIDESKIKQVLINFIKNAIEALPLGGSVLIELNTEFKNDIVHISIKDNGDGMTKEEVDKLGTPFFTTKDSGLGMGLPICFDIIKSHFGNIEINSEIGEGTTVHLFLPLDFQEKSL